MNLLLPNPTSPEVARTRTLDLLVGEQHDSPPSVVALVRPADILGTLVLKSSRGLSTPLLLKTARPRPLRFSIRLNSMRGPKSTLWASTLTSRSRLTRSTPPLKSPPVCELSLRASVKKVSTVKSIISIVFTTSIANFSCTDRSIGPTLLFLTYSSCYEGHAPTPP